LAEKETCSTDESVTSTQDWIDAQNMQKTLDEMFN
jgi:hypothetical protein